MTPKEKARQLFNKYNSFDFNTIVNQTHRRYAKQCALIAVDEIIKSNPTELNEKFYLHPYTSEYIESSLAYWQEVKQEIEAL